MKKTLITIAAVMALSLGTFAQGSLNLDNSTLADGSITVDTVGNYYGGLYGVEVWVLNGTAQSLAPINSLAGLPNSATAYSQLAALGFTLQGTFANRNNTGNDGILQVGQVNMPGVNPAGTTVTVALAAWVGSAASWNAAAGIVDAKGGVVAFYNATADYTASPVPTPPTVTGWDAANTDLIMTTIVPEPSTFALAGLGVAALLAFRRRK